VGRRPDPRAEVAGLDRLDADAFVAAVSPLFEGAPRFLRRLADARPHGSADALFARARAIAHAMPEAEQLELIDAHPRLGAAPGSLSLSSYREQGHAGERGPEREPESGREPGVEGTAMAAGLAGLAAELERLNAAYEARFGFRYCVFVAGRPRAALLPAMASALEADRRAEISRALDAVVDIAANRHAKMTPMGNPGPGMPASIELGSDRYGKSAIRLVRVFRGPAGHTVRDLTIAIALEGDFGASYIAGDNSGVVATDTMKNTAYAYAQDHLGGATEVYGQVLAGHFLEFAQVTRSTVTIRDHRWSPVPTPDGPARDAFSRDPSMTRLAVITATREGVMVEAGIEDLAVMKTAKSSFAGFPRDEYTTLRDSSDRIMATQLTARWRYDTSDVDHDALFVGVRDTLLEVFAEHDSPSVQASIWIMGRAVLERHVEVREISFSLPNLHHWLADLTPFGRTNDNEVFIATREPHGLIEATVRRT